MAEWKRPEAPENWKVLGYLPDCEDVESLSRNEIFSLSKDLVLITSPNGKYHLDVGWYPENDITGEFRCSLIKNKDWDNPENEVITRNPNKVFDWIQKTVEVVTSG